MTPDEITSLLRSLADDAFSRLGYWSSKDAALRAFRPGPGEWNIDEIIEHIMLANRYLLILIKKGAEKAIKKAGRFDIEKALRHYVLANPRLEQIGVNDSFEWKPPAHMLPAGAQSLFEVWEELKGQKEDILRHISMLAHGEGVLHKTWMSVNSLGGLDVYQYIYFLLMHMRRHIEQMKQNEAGFSRNN
jgi:hypothetical protein